MLLLLAWKFDTKDVDANNLAMRGCVADLAVLADGSRLLGSADCFSDALVND
jgi:hypothetical protein